MDQLLGEVMVEAHKLVKYAGKDRLELISENRLSASLQYIQIDGRRIEQVLLHLISNAVKFTQNGFVLIGCEADEAQGMLRFFVEDTGIGISAEHIKLIFQRFWKQGELYTQSYRGIGIGLSLCDELVRLMGGAFSVESMPDKGSVFRFTIRYEKA